MNALLKRPGRLLVPMLFWLYILNQSGGTIGGNIALPQGIASMSQMLTMIIVMFIWIYGAFSILFANRSLYVPLFFFALFFGLLLVHTLVSGDKFAAHLALFLISLLFVPGICFLLRNYSIFETLIYIAFTMWLYLIISIGFSFFDLASGSRATGLLANPNTFGFSLVGCVSLLSVTERKLTRGLFCFWGVALCLAVLTGSRLALGGYLLVTPFALRIKMKNERDIALFVVGATVLCILVFWNIDNLLNWRAFHFGTSVTDSGRWAIWNRAIEAISSSYLTGIGSNVTEVIGRDNVHNSYLRLFLMAGIPVGSVCLVIFALGIMYIVKSKHVDTALRGFFLAVPILIVAEDYIFAVVGVFAFFFWVLLALSWKFRHASSQR